jgi:hypothetical protein
VRFALLLVLGLPCVPSGSHAQTSGGTQLVNEDFTGPAVLDPNFSVQGATCLTGRAIGAPLPPGAANIPDCRNSRTGPVPTPGMTPGYLQFTDTQLNQTGSILYNRPVPSSAGLIATFDQFQYGGSTPPADGIAFYLVDGATVLSTPGGFGGSLGYAQRTGVPGITGGYVGIGFDTFGNFYNDLEGRGTRGQPWCAPDLRWPAGWALPTSPISVFATHQPRVH